MLQGLAISAAGAMIIVLALGPLLIPLLRRLKFGQSIRDDGPQGHKAKAGTPTMGGVMILTALPIAAYSAGILENKTVWGALLLTLACGLLGFLDDYIKVVLKRNLGLKARQKLAGQLLISAGFSWFLVTVMGKGTSIWIPLLDKSFDFGLLYYLVVFLVVIGTTNAVNLTDGLDGLAAGTGAVASAAYAAVAWLLGNVALAGYCLAVMGALLGFLVFNRHPAKVFMGDTGSLAIGGFLAAVALLSGTELLLPLIGGIFVLETASVIIQVISFKTTGKRVFRMSPLHHHFELGGWPETKVVQVFWVAGVVFGILGLAILKLGHIGGV